MTKNPTFWILMSSVIALAACGTGKDPTALLQDAEDGAVVKTMSLPFSSTTQASFAFTSAYAEGGQDYIRFTAVGTPAVINPIAGVIVENTGTGVTIRHNQGISVKISGVTSIFRAGEYLNTGDSVGTVNANGLLDFSVLNNGVAVCPLSFLDKSNRTLLVSKTVGGNQTPCLY